MTEVGYYLAKHKYWWSVRWYRGQWCLFCWRPEDVLAHTAEQVAAVREHELVNREKYRASSLSSLSR